LIPDDIHPNGGDAPIAGIGIRPILYERMHAWQKRGRSALISTVRTTVILPLIPDTRFIATAPVTIAFVLVAIVVFLFLGKLRTTVIPLVAVPVSIVGTFAVMLVSSRHQIIKACDPTIYRTQCPVYQETIHA
jgi:hypothetical protein